MPHISELPVGHELIDVRFQVQPWEVQLYLEAVEETDSLFWNDGFVPPSAVGAYALRGILKEINLPPGAIHVANDISMSKAIPSEGSLNFSAVLTQNIVRSGWRFVTVDFSGVDDDSELVIHGRSTVMIAESGNKDKVQ